MTDINRMTEDVEIALENIQYHEKRADKIYKEIMKCF